MKMSEQRSAKWEKEIAINRVLAIELVVNVTALSVVMVMGVLTIY